MLESSHAPHHCSCTPQCPANQVTLLSDGVYRLLTTATPEHGKANQAVIKLLADFLKIAPSRLTLVFGKTAKEKIVEIA